MKKFYCYSILIATCSIAHVSVGEYTIPTVFLPKPQGYYTMHYRRPHQDNVVRCAQPAITGLILSYQESRKADEIARTLFGSSSWHFTGSQIPHRNTATDILADNFGLSPNFDGTLFFKPHIKSITFDLSYQLTLSSWCENLYIELAAPLVHTRWSLGMYETINQQGMGYFPVGDMSNTSTTQPAQTILQAVGGNFTRGDLQVPWYQGHITTNTKEMTRLADISAALGGTIYRSEQLQVRAAILTLMPTGNHYSPQEIFSPVIGNASRWELGGTWEMQFHWEPRTHHTFDFYCTGVATHIFSSNQYRIFDFTEYGALSRYLLLKQMNVLMVDGVYTYPYANVLNNAINFATRFCKVSCPLQGDITFQATYRHKELQLDVGYNFYGRTNECIHTVKYATPSNVQGYAYAPKGTEGAYYRLYEGDPITTELLPPPPLTSAQLATIHGPGPIELPMPVSTGPNQVALTWNSNNNNSAVIGQSIAQITSSPSYQPAQTSNPPQFLTVTDLNAASAAAPNSQVQTLFAQIGYRWDTPCIEPAVLIGVATMFGKYGYYDALCEWSTWAQFNVRF